MSMFNMLRSDKCFRCCQCHVGPVVSKVFNLSARFRCLHTSLQEVDIQMAEADEEMSAALSEALDQSNILEYLIRAKLSLRQSQETPERC